MKFLITVKSWKMTRWVDKTALDEIKTWLRVINREISDEVELIENEFKVQYVKGGDKAEGLYSEKLISRIGTIVDEREGTSWFFGFVDTDDLSDESLHVSLIKKLEVDSRLFTPRPFCGIEKIEIGK